MLILILSILLSSCSTSIKPSNIDIINSDGLNVKLVDSSVFIHYKGKNVYTSPFSKSTHITFNSKRDLLFINDSCFSKHSYEDFQYSRYKESSSNLRIDIEKYNDSMLLINNYILSEIDLFNTIESVQYLGEDSMDYAGNMVYSVFIPKTYHSNIYNTKTKKKVFKSNVAKINLIEDLIVVYQLEKIPYYDWDEYMFDQNIYKLDSNGVSFLCSTNKNDTIDRKLGYMKLSSFSENIDSISFFSHDLFFLYKNKSIDLYRYKETLIISIDAASLPLDKKMVNNLDSVKMIPFYKNAFISYKQGSKYLNFTHRQQVKSKQFSKIDIKNYLVRKKQYSNYEVTLFSIDSSTHFISHNYNYSYILPKLINTLSPLDSITSNHGILDTIPINTLSF
jgi:hypothetical protein